MIAAVVLVLGLSFVLALWDAARRAIAHQDNNLALMKRLNALEIESDKQHQQLQVALGKLNAVAATTASRIPRLGPRS